MPKTTWSRLYPRWASTDSSGEYLAIQNDEESEFKVASDDSRLPTSSQSFHHPRIFQRLPSCIKLLLFTLSLSVIILASLYINLQLKLRIPEPLNCGRTVEEAHAKGCIFDTLSKAWLPSKCSFHGLDEYTMAGVAVSNSTEKPWPFYRGKEQKQEISIDEMSRMAASRKADVQEFQTSTREHVTHCAWMLIRMAHAYKFGERRDWNIDSFEHTQHCALYLLNRSLEAPGNDDITVRGNVIFGGC